MALDRAGPSEVSRARIDQSVVEPLMAPLVVIVLDVLADDSPKVAFAERDHLSDAL